MDANGQGFMQVGNKYSFSFMLYYLSKSLLLLLPFFFASFFFVNKLLLWITSLSNNRQRWRIKQNLGFQAYGRIQSTAAF